MTLIKLNVKENPVRFAPPLPSRLCSVEASAKTMQAGLRPLRSSRSVLIMFILIISAPSFSQTIPEKVRAYAIKNLGKKVDRGECWDLANAALNDAKANWSPPYGFGDKKELPQSKPGDIIQFTDVKLKFPFGSMSFPKHTAIVYASSGKHITLIHQNFNNKRVVDTVTIHLDYIVKGKAEPYRPK